MSQERGWERRSAAREEERVAYIRGKARQSMNRSRREVESVVDSPARLHVGPNESDKLLGSCPSSAFPSTPPKLLLPDPRLLFPNGPTRPPSSSSTVPPAISSSCIRLIGGVASSDISLPPPPSTSESQLPENGNLSLPPITTLSTCSPVAPPRSKLGWRLEYSISVGRAAAVGRGEGESVNGLRVENIISDLGEIPSTLGRRASQDLVIRSPTRAGVPMVVVEEEFEV
jgi:hypothetical protein